MIDAILTSAVRSRWSILFATIVMALFGAWQLNQQPIAVTPDISNKQMLINTVVPTLSTVEVEKQVTYPIETALTGLDGVETVRSLSRNGFSQVTAIFKESATLYFMRQQVAERLARARADLPDGASRSWVHYQLASAKYFATASNLLTRKVKLRGVPTENRAGRAMVAF